MSPVKKILEKTPLLKIIKIFRQRNISARQIHHDKVMRNFYSQFTSPGDLVFDVGANIGNRTKIFLELGLKVVAIEPQDECVNTLKSLFRGNDNLTIIQKVLGSSEGEAELMICDSNTISSLSQDWIAAVKSSGRFADHSWDKKKIIPMTTLDNLISQYGTPSFIKIDVEGFEYQVLTGLSKPVNYISLEFATEYLKATFNCIDHLESLGDAIFNYSLGESMKLELDKYIQAKEIKDILNKYKDDITVFGDLYCQIKK